MTRAEATVWDIILNPGIQHLVLQTDDLDIAYTGNKVQNTKSRTFTIKCVPK
jgi:hypothetical protein